MSTLLSRAESDIMIAKLLLSPEGNPTNDEMITDQAAYHAQQAIEKALKYKTELMGIEYRKTHNLVGLIADLKNNGFEVSSELKEKAVEISGWEASSRYNDDFIVVKADIENAIELFDRLKESILESIDVVNNEKDE